MSSAVDTRMSEEMKASGVAGGGDGGASQSADIPTGGLEAPQWLHPKPILDADCSRPRNRRRSESVVKSADSPRFGPRDVAVAAGAGVGVGAGSPDLIVETIDAPPPAAQQQPPKRRSLICEGGPGPGPLVYRQEYLASVLTSSVRSHDEDTALCVVKTGLVTNHALECALYRASKRGMSSLVEALAGAGANIETKSPYQQATPLYKAASAGHAEAVQSLLAHGASPSTSDRLGLSPLHRACHGGHVKCVLALLSAGACFTAPCHKGNTPLMWAAMSAAGDAAASNVRILLSRFRAAMAAGASNIPKLSVCLNQLNKDGMTALALACSKGHWVAARLLIDAGADVNLAAAASDHPLVAACTRRDSAEVVQLLLSKGAKAQALGSRRQTALIRAARLGSVELIRIITEHCVSSAKSMRARAYHRMLEARDTRGASALVWAALRGHADAVSALLARGAAPDGSRYRGSNFKLAGSFPAGSFPAVSAVATVPAKTRTRRNTTALMAAAHHGRGHIIRRLLMAGASVATISVDGRAPLFYAIRGGDARAVRLLLAVGAAVVAPGCLAGANMPSPLHVAATCEDLESLRLLLQGPVPVEVANSALALVRSKGAEAPSDKYAAMEQLLQGYVARQTAWATRSRVLVLAYLSRAGRVQHAGATPRSLR